MENSSSFAVRTLYSRESTVPNLTLRSDALARPDGASRADGASGAGPAVGSRRLRSRRPAWRAKRLTRRTFLRSLAVFLGIGLVGGATAIIAPESITAIVIAVSLNPGRVTVQLSTGQTLTITSYAASYLDVGDGLAWENNGARVLTSKCWMTAYGPRCWDSRWRFFGGAGISPL